jgi:hypothetical protein
VQTADAVFIVDLDARTLERRAGPNASHHPTDSPRPLRGVEICRVGEPAFMTVVDVDSSGGYRWQITGEVSRIERVEGAP